MRGFAAGVVLIAHYFGEVKHGLPGFTMGWMGVNLFFVLSGFLIGSIIFERRNSSNFIQVFYVRRGFRVIPIYLLTISLALICLNFLGSVPWIEDPLPTLSYFTFTQNIFMVVIGDYGTHWLLPTWTLAVEEQFYLLVPLLFLAFPSHYILPFILGGIATGFGVRATIYYADWGEIGGQVLLLSRCDILLCGVLTAYVHQRLIVSQMVLRLIPLVATLGTLLASIHMHLTDSSLFHVIAPLLVAALFASYVLLAVQGSELLRPFRSTGWRFLGSISYGLYLVHQPIAGIMHGLILNRRPDIGTLAEFGVTIAAALVSICVAWLSWKFIESPLLRVGQRWQYN
ncbi:hypothetical protein AA309_13205 [Microvirga vignae]|uniref:Acyltransferase 3 domain-containing protein n=2 Tax=Microvirga vignae TaxID=1225564 RepID=A0A0H1RD53_9HYPH|nr:hypothetical protein AA309_13205 [Microvirga vignae]